MESLLQVAIEFLRLVPLILAFYIPALVGVVIWRERGEGYRAKTAAVFAVGFGAIVGAQVLVRSVSALQVAATIGLSVVLILIALTLAAATVYKLAD